MHRGDAPRDSTPSSADRVTGSEASGGAISVALMAGLACIPIVVAVGFLSEHFFAASVGPAVPSDISVLELRGRFDGAADKRAGTPARAGY